jgi:hypothetical protein
MSPLFRIRRFLNLRQTDISRATGVPMHRISSAERGLSALTETEHQLIIGFLTERMKGLDESYSQVFPAEIHA